MKIYVPEDFKEGGISITVENNRIDEIKASVTRNRTKIKCEDLKKLLIYEGVLSPDQISSYHVEYIYQDGFRLSNGQYGSNWYLSEEDNEEEKDVMQDEEPETTPIQRITYTLPNSYMNIEPRTGRRSSSNNEFNEDEL